MLRKAVRGDMRRIFEIRQSVRENRLGDTFEEYAVLAGPYVDRGHCWVWEEYRSVGDFYQKHQANSRSADYVQHERKHPEKPVLPRISPIAGQRLVQVGRS